MAKVKEDLSRVRLEVDGKQAINQLGKLEMEAKELQIDMKNAKKGTDEYVAASKKLREVESRISGMRKELGLTGMTMQQLTRYQTQLRKEINNTTTRGTADYKKLNAELTRVNRAIAQQRAELNGTQGFFSGLSRNISSIAASAGIFLGAQGIIMGFQKVLGVAGDFGQSLADLSAITGATGEQLNQLEQAARRIGSTTTLTAQQAADAFTIIASKKPELLENNEALIATTESAIKLAEAAGIDLVTSADALTNSLNQFNLSADESDRFINVLAAGSKYGAGNIEYLNDAVKRFGPAANEMNISFEQSVAMMEVFAEKGIESEKSGIQFRNILIKLASGAEEFNPKIVGMEKALANLEAQQFDTAQIAKMFGAENLIAAQIMMQSGKRFAEFTEKVTGTNVALEQADIRTNTWKGDLKALMSVTEEYLIGAGNLVMKGLRPLIQVMTEFMKIPISEKLTDERTELNKIYLQITDVNIKNEDRIKLIKQLQEQYPAYLGNIDAEFISNENLAGSIKKINDMLVNKIILQSKDEEIQKQNEILAKRNIQQMDTEDKIRERMVKMAEKYNIKIDQSLSLIEQAKQVGNQSGKQSLFKDILFGQGDAGDLFDDIRHLEDIIADKNKLEGSSNALLDERAKLIKRLGLEAETALPAITGISRAGFLQGTTPTEGEPTADGTDDPVGGGNSQVNRYLSNLEAIYTGYQAKMADTQADIFKSTEEHLNELIELHKANGLDIVALEAERDRIRLEGQKRGQQLMLEEDIKITNAKEMIAQGLSQSLGAAIDFIGNRQGELTTFQKLLAASQIAIDTAVSLGKIVPLAIEASKNTGPAAPFVLAGYIATMAATVLGAIAKAKSALSKSDVPSWNPSDEKKPSRSPGGSPSRKSFFYGGYTGNGNMGAGDQYGPFAGAVHQREYVIPEVTVSDPVVANLLPAIEQIRQDNIRGFSGGGAGTITTSDPELKALMKQLIGKFDTMPTKLKAYMVYSDLEELEAEDQLLKDRYRA